MAGDVASSVRKLFYDCAQMNDWWITRLAVMSDHVHLLLELPPTVSVSQAVKTFKDGQQSGFVPDTS
jgi:putative transposase